MNAESIEQLQTQLDRKAHSESYCYPKKCTRIVSPKYQNIKETFVPNDMRYWD